MSLSKVLATIAWAIASTASSAAQIQTVPPPVIRSPRTTQPPPGNPNPLPGGKPHREQYTALEFTVWTGDDDLRSESKLVADVKFNDSSIECILHEETDDSWGNNTKHQGHQCILTTPKTWSELRAAKIVMSLSSIDDINRGLNFDNWNVNRVSVTAIDAADKHYPCLVDVVGNPLLVRMKATQSSYDLTETKNRC